MFDCILLMAGSGKRTGLNYNKINYKINGKELYKYSLDKFLSLKEVGKVILAVNENDYDIFKDLENERIKICIGGKERQDSVYNALKLATSDIVLIHDAARPNTSVEEILAVYDNTVKYDCAVLASPCIYAIKEVKDGFVTKTIDRSNVYTMQTPQGVRREMMIKALESIDYLIYDDVEAIEKIYDIKAKIVLGSNDNIKLTTKADLKYFEYLLGENNE